MVFIVSYVRKSQPNFMELTNKYTFCYVLGLTLLFVLFSIFVCGFFVCLFVCFFFSFPVSPYSLRKRLPVLLIMSHMCILAQKQCNMNHNSFWETLLWNQAFLAATIPPKKAMYSRDRPMWILSINKQGITLKLSQFRLSQVCRA